MSLVIFLTLISFLSHFLYSALFQMNRRPGSSLEQCIPSPVNHLLGCKAPCTRLLKSGSSRLLCLLIMWLRNVLNLTQISPPLPLKVG